MRPSEPRVRGPLDFDVRPKPEITWPTHVYRSTSRHLRGPYSRFAGTRVSQVMERTRFTTRWMPYACGGIALRSSSVSFVVASITPTPMTHRTLRLIFRAGLSKWNTRVWSRHIWGGRMHYTARCAPTNASLYRRFPSSRGTVRSSWRSCWWEEAIGLMWAPI